MMNFVQRLQVALGEGSVLTEASDLAAFETDWRKIHSHKAVCVVLPRSTEEVAAALKLAGEMGVKVVPQGGNTGLVAGGVPVEGAAQMVLSLKRMNRIFVPDEVGNTIEVEAGATVQAVQDAAAKVGRLFPVSFGAEGTAQMGGVISTNAGGIQVLAYGSMRTQVLGLEVVLADGRVWDGMRALRKDNTGFDLKQIFVGAEGCLGVVTRAVLKIQPAVMGRATGLVGVGSLDAALTVFGALRAAVGPGLTMCEFWSRAAMDLSVAHVAGGRRPFEAANYMLVEISAHGAGERIEELLLQGLDGLLQDGTVVDALIAQSERERLDLLRLREGIPEGELLEGGAVKHDVSVPIGKIPQTVAAIERVVAERFADCRLNVFGHVGDGNLHVNVRPPAGVKVADLGARYGEITEAVEAVAVGMGGSFSAEHGIGQMRIAGMAAHKSEVELALMRALKRAFDPMDILNPGKVLPAVKGKE